MAVPSGAQSKRGGAILVSAFNNHRARWASTMTTTQKVQEAFRSIVGTLTARNRARWGNAESVEVIEKLVELLQSDEEIGLEGFDAIRARVAQMVNPSAFAQNLEELPDGTGLDKEGKPDNRTFDEATFTLTNVRAGEALVPHPFWLRRPSRGPRAVKNF